MSNMACSGDVSLRNVVVRNIPDILVSDGLLLYWPLSNEYTDGDTVTDRTEFERDGTVDGGSFTDTDIGSDPGAYYASSTSHTVTNGDILGLQSDEEFSYAFWMRVESASSAAFFSINYDGDDHRGVDLWQDGNGELACHIIHWWSGNAIKTVHYDDGSEDYINHEDGNWHHITVTYDGSTDWDGCKIYIDSVQQPTEASNDNLEPGVPIGTNYSPIRLNGRSSGTGHDGGNEAEFADVRIYDRELSQNEIDELSKQ